MPRDITRLKKSSSQALAIADRRRLVHLRLQQHLTIRQIAEQLGVTTRTIVADKKAIAKSLSAEHTDVKSIDLDDLDSMERECIEQLEQRIQEIQAVLTSGDDDAKILKTMYDNAGSWWDKRLRLKQLRGKWLGYEATTAAVETVNQDNSIKILVQAPQGEASFQDYVKGILDAST
jgi:transcriptional regulator with XRE-family HTH domain